MSQHLGNTYLYPHHLVIFPILIANTNVTFIRKWNWSCPFSGIHRKTCHSWEKTWMASQHGAWIMDKLWKTLSTPNLNLTIGTILLISLFSFNYWLNPQIWFGVTTQVLWLKLKSGSRYVDMWHVDTSIPPSLRRRCGFWLLWATKYLSTTMVREFFQTQ